MVFVFLKQPHLKGAIINYLTRLVGNEFGQRIHIHLGRNQCTPCTT